MALSGDARSLGASHNAVQDMHEGTIMLRLWITLLLAAASALLLATAGVEDAWPVAGVAWLWTCA